MIMATAHSSEDNDITKCSICLEVFKIPKYLPCLHTFCETCLNSYITSAFEKGDNKGNKNQTDATFNCPVCRGSTKPSDSSKPYHEWAGQFPINHLIVTLIDQNKLKSKVKLCDPCQTENKEAEAVSWCTDCNEPLCEICMCFHKKFKMSKNHLLQNINEITSVKQISSPQCCENHKGKTIDAFCVDHDLPCCTTCIAIHHRKCDHVTTLEEAADGVSESQSLTDLLHQIEESNQLVKAMLKENKSNVDDLEHQKSDIKDKLKKLRMSVIKHLDELESNLLKELSNIHKQKVTELTSIINDLENRMRIAQNYSNVLQTCREHASDIHIFLEMKKIGQRHKKQEEALQELLSNHKRFDYQFESDKMIDGIVSSVKRIGSVTVNQTEYASSKQYRHGKFVSLKDCLPKKHSSFSVKDKFGNTNVVGGTFMSDKSLLLPLYHCNKLVKVSHTGDIVQQMNISGSPNDVTMIDDNTAAVTRNTDRVVDFIDIRTFTVTNTISTGGYCYGIFYDNDKLYIGCYDKILVLHKNGNKLNEISTKGSNVSITVAGSTDRKVVYVNYSRNSCHFLRATDLQEIKTFIHHDLKNPRCVISDRDGNVYITGQTSGNVFQLSAEGEFIRIIFSGIINPTAIKFDGDTNKFFLVHSGNSPTIDFYELEEPSD